MSRTNGDDTTVYVGGLLEMDSDSSGVTDSRTFYAFAGVPVGMRSFESAASVFIAQDHLGSAVAAFDDTNDEVATMLFTPWGEEQAASGELPSDHRFTGQIADTTNAASAGSDLVFYNARYYDPEVGAFVAGDTIVPDMARPVDLNRYVYARANPVYFADPTGHTVKPGQHIVGDTIEDPAHRPAGHNDRHHRRPHPRRPRP